MLTLENLPGWKQRCCPTCGTVCDECVANAEEDLRNALGDLD
jgi:formylmethanofuran dehydrogenase subunit B